MRPVVNLRLHVTAQHDGRIVQPLFDLFQHPILLPTGNDQQKHGSHLIISDVQRIPPESVDPRVKNYHWGDFTRGLFDAYDRGGETVVQVRRGEAEIASPEGVEILKRGKMGFGVPLDHWFRGNLETTLRETILSPRALERGYFDGAAVEGMVDRHVSGQIDHQYSLFNLMMLEMWHRTWIDPPQGAAIPVDTLPANRMRLPSSETPPR